ncbi:hydroxymethylglutaryl-CoA synthase [Candidatus Woesebacteria bacterium]|nr:hydroxymethylglutaryl-CoA synthase [Candidatus Woesebacteria bacterium]
MVGIVDYGFYIPKYRIKISDIALQWGKCADKIEKSLQVTEKAVASRDEDMMTMAYEAGLMALSKHANLKPDIGAVFIGSETFPYAVKPVSTSLAEWLGLGHDYLGYDTQFACKAGTGALISASALIKSGDISHALVFASDKANAKPKDTLEYSAGSGANAWLLGSQNVILNILDWHSYSSDTPDFWRRAKAEYPSHAGRFTGSPAYFKHIISASESLMKKQNITAADVQYGVFHMPNGTFPLKVAQKLGFTKEQVEKSYIVPKLGNSYSASALMGLVATLEYAKPGDRIFFASYGSGAGSDAILFEVTEHILARRKQFSLAMENKSYITYGAYMKYMNII